jgi:endonuclease/exonuclease/phosphatase (EEP) superfamily protein YafD
MKSLVAPACWSTAVASVAVALFGHLGSVGPLTAMLVALTPIVVVATAVALVAASAVRQWLMVVVLAGLLVPTLVAESMERAPTRQEAIRTSGLAITIVSSNVRTGNEHVEDLVADIASEQPDIVVLQEIGPADLTAIRRTDLARSHEHMFADARPGYFGGVVFSRWPVSGRVEDVGGHPMIVATVETPTGLLDVVNVHVVPPTTSVGHRLWARQLDELADRLSEADRPVVVVGDFNATEHHDELRSLAEASSDRGLAAFRSFPFNEMVPPMLSLDHVFAAGGACLRNVDGTAENSGSDHRAMRAIVEGSFSREAGCR